MPTIQDYLRKMLSVRRLTSNLRVTPTICGADGGVTVPAAHKTTGIANADLLIYVTIRPTATTTLAWAVECQEDTTTYQPRVGQINVNPTSFASSDDKLVGIMLHEITHILGFRLAYLLF